MSNASILMGGKAVIIDNYSELRYGLNGFLNEFKINASGLKYVYSNRFTFSKVSDKYINGYFLEEELLKYYSKKISINDLSKFLLKSSDVERAKKDDIIVTYSLHLDINSNVFYKLIKRTFILTNINNGLLDLEGNIIYPNTTSSSSPIDNSHIQTQLSKDFFINNFYILNHFNSQEDKLKAYYYLTIISIFIDLIEFKIFSKFSQNTDGVIYDYIIQQREVWLNGNIFGEATLEKLIDFKESIESFYLSGYSNLINLETADVKERLYVLALSLDSQALVVMINNKKLELLDYLLKNKRLSEFFEKIEDEKLVLNIIASFNNYNIDQIDFFLEKLVSIFPYSGVNITLYEALYKCMSKSTNFKEGLLGISNWVFGTQYQPTHTKSQFVQILYVLWQNSKYNPYNEDGSLKMNTIGFKNVTGNSFTSFSNEIDFQNFLFHYTHNTAFEAEEIQNLQLNFDKTYYKYKVVYKNASPMVMPYESEKEIGIYFDNYKFVILGNKIKAYQELTTWGCSYSKVPSPMSLDYDEWIEFANNQCDDQYKGEKKIDVLYGTYDIFQPVSLLNVNVETKSALTTVEGEDIYENGNKINSFIPVFVLAHIDSEGDRSDAETMIGYVTDVAFTFSGVGSLSKLRQLKWAATGTSQIGFLTIEGLNIMFDTLTFSSQVLNYISIIAGDCDEGDDFCEKFKNFSNILNISCLSVNGLRLVGISSYALINESYRLVETIRAGATSENLIKANIRARLMLYNVQATNETINQCVDNIFGLYSRRGNLNVSIDPVIHLTFAGAKYVLERVTNFLIKQQNSLYKTFDNYPVGYQTKTPPRFSPFIWTKTTTNEGVKFTKTALLLHTDTEIYQIIQEAKNLNLKDSVIYGFILKSYRTVKQKNASDVIQFMTKYHEFLTIRGYAYIFNNLSHQTAYMNLVISIFNRYGLEKYLDEVHLSGSALYAGQGLVPDVDLVSFALQGKLRNIYIENGNIFINNKDLILKLLEKKYYRDVRIAHSIFNKLSDFYEPLVIARKSSNPNISIKNIPINKMSSKFIIRIQDVGGVKTFYSLGEELYDIKKSNPSIAPILSSQKNRTDFNIFKSGDNGRRLQPDLTFKID